jgi:general secretion pathway protein A
MYEKHWKLEVKPFQNTPDPKFLYSAEQHEDALMKLTYAVTEGLGAGMLTGIFGCGKTLLGHALAGSIEAERHKIAYIQNPLMDNVELLRGIVRSLTAAELPERRSELMADACLEDLQKVLIDNMDDGKNTIVVIDEAHSISDPKTLEEIRLLLNFQLQNKFLLTLLLLGQPELTKKVEDLKPLDQRIAIKCHLKEFGEEDTGKYIAHRLKVAGRDEPIFNTEAIRLIYEKSGGIPRRINRICDLSLLTGFGRKADQVDGAIVKKSLQEFGN